MQHYFLLDGEHQGCAAPFSWLLRLHLENLWEQSAFMPGLTEFCCGRGGRDQKVISSARLCLLATKEDGSASILQFVSAFNHSGPGRRLQKLSAREQLEYGHLYLHDFLLLSLKIKSKDKLRV